MMFDLNDLPDRTSPEVNQAIYRFHKRFLQTLQHRDRQHGRSPARFLLKTPAHLGFLPELFATYPDARIAFTHRDPLKFIGSSANLTGVLHWMRSDDVDLSMRGPIMAAVYEILLGGAMQQRIAGKSQPSRSPTSISERLADPVATIEEACPLGVPFHESMRSSIPAYLESKPKGKFGIHRYDPLASASRVEPSSAVLRLHRTLRRRTGAHMSDRPAAAAVFDDLITALTEIRDGYVLTSSAGLTRPKRRSLPLRRPSVVGLIRAVLGGRPRPSALCVHRPTRPQTAGRQPGCDLPLRPDSRRPHVCARGRIREQCYASFTVHGQAADGGMAGPLSATEMIDFTIADDARTRSSSAQRPMMATGSSCTSTRIRSSSGRTTN